MRPLHVQHHAPRPETLRWPTGNPDGGGTEGQTTLQPVTCSISKALVEPARNRSFPSNVVDFATANGIDQGEIRCFTTQLAPIV